MSADDPIHEETFRARCAASCVQHPDVPRIKNIAAVGVYDAVIGSPDKDSARLTQVMDYALRSGFLIDPEFVIDAINFRENRDFLFEDKPADLIFVSYIISGSFPFLPKFWKGETDNRDSLSLIDMVSRRNDPVEWAHHAQEIGAKLVATYGGNVEINAQAFSEDYGVDYTVLIPSPDDECCGRYVPAHAIKTQYPGLPDIDLPQGWFGFSAQSDYLRATAPSLTKDTCLARQARKYLQTPEPQGLKFPKRLPGFRL